MIYTFRYRSNVFYDYVTVIVEHNGRTPIEQKKTFWIKIKFDSWYLQL